MLANGTKFAGNAPPGPQQLDPVAGTTFRTNAFGGFFAEAKRLNAFDSHFGVEISIFCFHWYLSIKKLGEGRAQLPSAGLVLKDRIVLQVTPYAGACMTWADDLEAFLTIANARSELVFVRVGRKTAGPADFRAAAARARLRQGRFVTDTQDGTFFEAEV